MFGPDHFFSLDPKRLNIFMKIFLTKKIIGKEYKIISNTEKNQF